MDKKNANDNRERGIGKKEKDGEEKWDQNKGKRRMSEKTKMGKELSQIRRNRNRDVIIIMDIEKGEKKKEGKGGREVELE